MLRTFAYVRPGSVSEALKQLEERGARVHAGGTDLLGCLRDGVFEAAEGREPRQARRAARHRRRAGRRAAHRRADDDRRDRRAPGRSRRSSRRSPRRRRWWPARSCATRAPSAATSASGRAAGTSAATTHCTRKGGEMCYAIGGENQYHAIFGGGACCHRPSVGHGAGAHRARREGAHRRAEGRARHPAREVLRAAGGGRDEGDRARAGRDGHSGCWCRPRAAGQKSGYRKVRARGSWDFAMAGLAHAVTMKAGQGRRRAPRALGRRADAVAAPRPSRSCSSARSSMRSSSRRRPTRRSSGAKPLEHNGYKVPLVRGLVEEVLGGMSGASTD